jgi:hypothetical protein
VTRSTLKDLSAPRRMDLGTTAGRRDVYTSSRSKWNLLARGYGRAKFLSCPPGFLHLVRLYRAGARTSPSPARARKNRALCLAASGKMRSSTRQHCFPVSEYRPPRPFFPSWKYLPRPKPIARGHSWKTTRHEGSSEDLFRH